ncbi:MAG TPA: MBL fold metallo-hydrolase [Armatimonadota bacterium]|jgi:L-ascorbate metabolism protein UlaG (beta-lactamase superfamily)
MANLREVTRPAHGDSITWFGHACFRITDAEGHTVIVDPYITPIMGQSLDGLSADVVIVTHEHSDHNNASAIRTHHQIHALSAVGDGRVTRVADSPTGLIFTLIPTFHDDVHGQQRGRNVVVEWEEGGVTFCHLGDLGQPLTGAQIAAIGRPDVLMLPVGGYYTMDGAAARTVVEQLKPSVVIPMHYRVPGMTQQSLPISTEEPFLDTHGNAPWITVKHLETPILLVDADHLPHRTEVDVLEVGRIP